MEWQPAEKYYQASANGRYTVSAALCNGEWIYSAWRCTSSPATPLGNSTKAARCRALCEHDAQTAASAAVSQALDAATQDTRHEQPA